VKGLWTWFGAPTPSDAEVKNEKNYTSNTLLYLHAILWGDLYIFTLYFSPNIIRSDQVKDDTCYTEREEDEKMLCKLCKAKM
jgi:deoxyribodipyrimidine photolyase